MTNFIFYLITRQMYFHLPIWNNSQNFISSFIHQICSQCLSVLGVVHGSGKTPGNYVCFQQKFFIPGKCLSAQKLTLNAEDFSYEYMNLFVLSYIYIHIQTLFATQVTEPLFKMSSPSVDHVGGTVVLYIHGFNWHVFI